jgi:hypothetical protein
MIYAILGSLITVGLFCTHYVAYQKGCRQGNKIENIKMTREEREETKKKIVGFENIMNYDYNVAIGRVKDGRKA